jgi:hypothetical protein
MPKGSVTHTIFSGSPPKIRPPVRPGAANVSRPTPVNELKMLTACASRYVEECSCLRSELDALTTEDVKAVDYATHLLDEAETKWQVCVDRVCATSCRSLDGLIEKARTIIDARIMREAGAWTENAEIRLATSIALDLLAWREGKVRS